MRRARVALRLAVRFGDRRNAARRASPLERFEHRLDSQSVSARALFDRLVLTYAASAAAQPERAHHVGGERKGAATSSSIFVCASDLGQFICGHGFSKSEPAKAVASGMQIERARAVLAGGCDSPVRSAWSVGGPMFVQSAARGAYAYDEAGRRYIDYVMAYGPLLFGHTHPALVAGLDATRAQTVSSGVRRMPQEVRLAERIRALPSLDGALALRHDAEPRR